MTPGPSFSSFLAVKPQWGGLTMKTATLVVGKLLVSWKNLFLSQSMESNGPASMLLGSILFFVLSGLEETDQSDSSRDTFWLISSWRSKPRNQSKHKAENLQWNQGWAGRAILYRWLGGGRRQCCPYSCSYHYGDEQFCPLVDRHSIRETTARSFLQVPKTRPQSNRDSVILWAAVPSGCS